MSEAAHHINAVNGVSMVSHLVHTSVCRPNLSWKLIPFFFIFFRYKIALLDPNGGGISLKMVKIAVVGAGVVGLSAAVCVGRLIPDGEVNLDSSTESINQPIEDYYVCLFFFSILFPCKIHRTMYGCLFEIRNILFITGSKFVVIVSCRWH